MLNITNLENGSNDALFEFEEAWFRGRMSDFGSEGHGFEYQLRLDWTAFTNHTTGTDNG